MYVCMLRIKIHNTEFRVSQKKKCLLWGKVIIDEWVCQHVFSGECCVSLVVETVMLKKMCCVVIYYDSSYYGLV